MTRLISIASLVIMFTSSATAAVYYYEPFNYVSETNLEVSSASEWTMVVGSLTNPIRWWVVESVGSGGSLEYSTNGHALPTAGKCAMSALGQSTRNAEYEHVLDTTYSNGVVWISWLAVDNKSSWMKNRIELFNGGSRRAWAGTKNSNPGTIYWANDGFHWSPDRRGDLSQGTNTGVAASLTTENPNFIVMMLDFVNQRAGTYVNPVPDPTVYPTNTAVYWDEDTAPDYEMMAFDRIRIVRQNWANNVTYMDEIRVAPTWPEAVGVPEPTLFALAGLALLGLRRRG